MRGARERVWPAFLAVVVIAGYITALPRESISETGPPFTLSSNWKRLRGFWPSYSTPAERSSMRIKTRLSVIRNRRSGRYRHLSSSLSTCCGPAPGSIFATSNQVGFPKRRNSGLK